MSQATYFLHSTFTQGLDGWRYLAYGDIDPVITVEPEGSNQQVLSVRNRGWLVNVGRSVVLEPGREYEVSFRVKSDIPIQMKVRLSSTHVPIETGPTWKFHSFKVIAGTPPQYVSFESPTGPNHFYLDDIVVREPRVS